MPEEHVGLPGEIPQEEFTDPGDPVDEPPLDVPEDPLTDGGWEY